MKHVQYTYGTHKEHRAVIYADEKLIRIFDIFEHDELKELRKIIDSTYPKIIEAPIDDIEISEMLNKISEADFAFDEFSQENKERVRIKIDELKNLLRKCIVEKNA